MHAVSSGKHILVIGAGIVGANCAFALKRAGFRVTLLEKDEPGKAASLGNSGSIGLASVTPLGVPGMLRKAPRMFLDPMHPLSIRPLHFPRAVPWFLRFAATLDEKRVRAIAGARAALLSLVSEAYDRLLDEIGHPELIYNNGLIFAYEREDGPQQNAFDIGLRRELGVRVEVMDGDELRRLEPALSKRIKAGVYYPDVRTTVHPGLLTTTIVDAFSRAGGLLVKDQARDFVVSDGRVTGVTGLRASYACDAVIVAAGAWSHRLVRRLGPRIPLAAERGYNITIAAPGATMKIPVVSGTRFVSIVPMLGAIRMTTGSEFADVDDPPNHAAAFRLFEAAAGTIEGLELKVSDRWMGSRPSTPDSLPVIGPVSGWPNVFCAFGHGHLGVTYGAITGDIVACLVTGRPPPLDIAPYRADRRYDGSDIASTDPARPNVSRPKERQFL